MRISDWSSDVCSYDMDHLIGLFRNAIGGGQVIGLVEIDVVHFGAGDEGLDLQRLVAFGYGCGDFLRLQHDLVAVARLIAFHLVVAFDGLVCLLIDILPRHPMARRAVEVMEADPLGDRMRTRLNSSNKCASRMPSSA